MSVEERIKTKKSQASTSENKAVIIMDNPGSRSNSFDMQIAEPLFEFYFFLPIPVTINTLQWNLYIDIMEIFFI